MSADLQVFFGSSPESVEASYKEPSLPTGDVDALVEKARSEAVEQLRSRYEAQINDIRSEAVEFHQQFMDRLEKSLTTWMSSWEAAVPHLVFSGVRAVLAEFEMTDEQLKAWFDQAIAQAGGGEKGGLEIQLSAENAARLEEYWKEHGMELPANCRLQVDESCSALDCRVVGQKGIVDASLPVRLAQLSRLWKVAP